MPVTPVRKHQKERAEHGDGDDDGGDAGPDFLLVRAHKIPPGFSL